MIQAADIDVSALTPLLKRLVRAIGVPATVDLLQARGGTRLYFKGERKRNDRRLLRDLVGEDAATALYAEFRDHGQELTLPKVDKILTQLRDRAIRAERGRGVGVEILARKYRLTRRHVSNICAAPEPAFQGGLQGELFGSPLEPV